MGAQSLSGLNAALVASLALLFIAPHTHIPASLIIFYIAVGLYAGVNLVSDQFIFIGREFVFGESRFDIAEFRWLPPLARSNSFFSMTCVVAMGGILNYFASNIRKLSNAPVVAALLGVSFSLCAYAAFKTQFRANILIIATACAWIVLKSLQLRRLMSYSLVILMLVFPTSFAIGIGHDVIAFVAPERLLEALGSKTGESDTLSERTLLYEYGGQRLLDPTVLLIGEGPIYRDAQDALGVYKTGGYRMPYHSASFDFLIDHGIVVGGSALLCIIFLLRYGFKALETTSRLQSPGGGLLEAALLNMVLWLSTSIMDSGISNLETFCFASFPVIGALAFAGRLPAVPPDTDVSAHSDLLSANLA
jgi:hypothetical protein